MIETYITDLKCDLITREGSSKKTGKPYRMLVLLVHTDYGVCDIVLDTRHDRSGIVLDMISRKEVKPIE